MEIGATIQGSRGDSCSAKLNQGDTMLSSSITFLIIAIIAAVLGFSGVAGTAAWIAQVLFVLFLVLFVISLVTGRKPSV
jgi:uncharacterized membrane protein YtjA (UPF0391 family)